MADISEVPGITGSLLQLLREAGITSAEALLSRSTGQVREGLAAANAGKEIPVRIPSEGTVVGWQREALGVVIRGGGEEVPPAAKMVRSADLRAAGIEVEEIPVARVLGESGSEPKVERPRRTVEGAAREAAPPVRPLAARMMHLKRPAAGVPASGAPPDAATVREGMPSREVVPELPRRSAPASQPAGSEQVAEAGALAGPGQRPEESAEQSALNQRFRSLEEVQKAKPPEKRRNRGMSHPDAGRVRLAGTVTILAATATTVTALALLAAMYMIWFHDWEFHWTIVLLVLVFPASLVCYLGIGTKARCRLCGQRLFVPKRCRKHDQAARSIFGYTFAVARDAMFTGSYRCMLCGTKTRLRD